MLLQPVTTPRRSVDGMGPALALTDLRQASLHVHLAERDRQSLKILMMTSVGGGVGESP